MKGWRSCTFSFLPEIVAKTQNLSVYDPHFEEFTVPSLADFVDGDRDEMLLCLVGALGRSSIGLSNLLSSYQRLRRRKTCTLETPFHLGLDWWFPMLISQPLMKIGGQLKLRLTIMSYVGGQLKLRLTMMSYVMRQWKQSSSCELLPRKGKENLPYDHVCLFTAISCCRCQHVIYVIFTLLFHCL